MIQKYLQIGTILSTHALRGEVRVYPTTNRIRRFDDLSSVLVSSDPEKGGEILEVESARYFKNLVLLKFRGIDRIEEVQKYLKKDLYVTREDAVPLRENEYYTADLYGLKVIDEENGRILGRIADVLSTGANDVYIVRDESDPKREILIPAIRDCIRKVDIEKGNMVVHLLKGLED